VSRCLLLGQQKSFDVPTASASGVLAKMSAGAWHIRVSDVVRVFVGAGTPSVSSFALDPSQDVNVRLAPGESLTFLAPLVDAIVWLTPLDDGMGA
jgi:hypothetical protein